MTTFRLKLFSLPPVNIATLNVRGMASRTKQHQLRRLLLTEQLDIVAVQETKISTDESTAQALEMYLGMYEVCVSHAVRTSEGCFLLLKKSVSLVVVSVVSDFAGRLVYCDS